MCFSKTVTNPVLLLASLGASDGTRSKLSFSKPYVVLFDGGNMEFHDSYSFTGVEGFAIFQNDNFISPWDGVLGGKPLPVGSYYHILDLANKSKTRYKGSITILR